MKKISLIMGSFLCLLLWGCGEDTNTETENENKTENETETENKEPGDCSGVGEIIDKSSNTCVCDADNHWTGNPGSCKCADDHLNINGVCEKKVTCSDRGASLDTKTNTCVCNTQMHWTGNDGNCTCEKDHFEVLWKSRDYACCVPVDYKTDFSQPSCLELENPKKDDICLLGKYRQLRKTEEEQPIQWRVLEIDQATGNAFLLSEYSLEFLPYNVTKKDVTWETCTLRSWLNALGASENADGIDYTENGFLKTAFTEDERSHIVTVLNVNLEHPTAHTPGGNSTNDQVFLLSREETRKYFTSRLAYGTSYVTGNVFMRNAMLCRGEDKTEFQYPLAWWTRSCSITADQARCISVFGNDCDMEVNSDGMTVRVAMWLKK